MEVLPVSGKDILNRLGIIKNELLIFTVLICIILNTSAYGVNRLQPPPPMQRLEALILYIASVVVIFLGAGFYIYAYLNLPPSSQAWIFSSGVRSMGREHEEQRPKAAKSSESENRLRKAAKAVKRDA